MTGLFCNINVIGNPKKDLKISYNQVSWLNTTPNFPKRLIEVLVKNLFFFENYFDKIRFTQYSNKD